MKGSESRLIEYMVSATKRFVIPVYQRNCESIFRQNQALQKIVILSCEGI